MWNVFSIHFPLKNDFVLELEEKDKLLAWCGIQKKKPDENFRNNTNKKW